MPTISRPSRNFIWRRAIDRRDGGRGRSRSAYPPRFRTIQVYPKDLRALPGHPEPAVSWHNGFREGAHARPKTTPVHHAARRRGRVAARGARPAGWSGMTKHENIAKALKARLSELTTRVGEIDSELRKPLSAPP
jgi:hypothetical protein